MNKEGIARNISTALLLLKVKAAALRTLLPEVARLDGFELKDPVSLTIARRRLALLAPAEPTVGVGARLSITGRVERAALCHEAITLYTVSLPEQGGAGMKSSQRVARVVEGLVVADIPQLKQAIADTDAELAATQALSVSGYISAVGDFDLAVSAATAIQRRYQTLLGSMLLPQRIEGSVDNG